MGLSIKKFVHRVAQPVERIIGKKATAVIFPVVPISKAAGAIADKVLTGALTPRNVSRVPVEQRTEPYAPQIVTYGAPGNTAPFYSGGGYAPSYPQAEPFYGGSPWDSSIQYSIPSTPRYQAYSTPPPRQADRTWEDLITVALPFIL